ncbi:MAG: CDP-diacylglycerol--serine O-phosphatidyltransferase [Thermoanaerobaculia bacterium]
MTTPIAGTMVAEDTMNETYGWSRRMLGPAAVTAANVVMGFSSILMAADGRYRLAVLLLLAAIVLDMMDGRLARKLRVTSKLGQELDSFSDAISFGLAPAFLVQRAILEPLGIFGLLIAAAYLLAAIFRLARFNLVVGEHSKERRTLGVPTPIAAVYLMALVLMREHVTPEVAVAVVLAMAVLMMSRIRLPDLVGRGMVGWALLIGMANYLIFVARPNWLTVTWWNLWNGVIVLASWWENRQLRLFHATSE